MASATVDMRPPPSPAPVNQGATHGHPGTSWLNFLNRIPEDDQIFYAFWLAVAALVLGLCNSSSSISS
jgi:hypothetical protein